MKALTFTNVRIAGSSILILISTQMGSFVPLDRIRENAQIALDNGRAHKSSSLFRDLLHFTFTFISSHLFQTGIMKYA